MKLKVFYDMRVLSSSWALLATLASATGAGGGNEIFRAQSPGQACFDGTNTCHNLATCVPDNNLQGYDCICHEGFYGNGGGIGPGAPGCHDIDECLTVNECNSQGSTCLNTFGSYICKNTSTPCISLHPQTCEDCKKLGPLCIQENGAEKVCKDLLWDGQKCQKEDTTKPCISLFPSRCADCERLGVRCIKNNDAEKQCEKFEFDFKKEKCPPVDPVCAQVEPTTCESCKKLGPKCVKENDSVDKCKALGYDIKKDACAEKPVCKGHEGRPQHCEDCLQMEKTCFKKGGHKNECKLLGYKPRKGICSKPKLIKEPKTPKEAKPVCATVVPGSCLDCLKIGRECLKATGQFKNCKKKFKMDRKIDMCPEQCPTVTKCIDCIQRPKMCVKSSAAVCKDLGFKRGECNKKN